MRIGNKTNLLTGGEPLFLWQEIKERRKKLGLTQKVFAEKVGIKQGYFAEIETGRKIPSRDLWKKIKVIIGENPIIEILYNEAMFNKDHRIKESGPPPDAKNIIAATLSTLIIDKVQHKMPDNSVHLHIKNLIEAATWGIAIDEKNKEILKKTEKEIKKLSQKYSAIYKDVLKITDSLLKQLKEK